MIIGLEHPCKVGEIIEGTYWKRNDERYPNVRALVLRESNIDEWREYRKENGILEKFEGEEFGHYYKVSVD